MKKQKLGGKMGKHDEGNVKSGAGGKNKPKNREVIGTEGDDALEGGPHAETLSGGGGDDVLNGNGGRDLLDGGTGNDILNGGKGNDVLKGGAGADQLSGGRGNDTLYIDAEDTVVDGGKGKDQVIVEGSEGVTLDLAASSIERATGGDGDDVFDASGMRRGVHLSGGDGRDVLIGGDKRDWLDGGAGNDTLIGGRGGDFLDGGAGVDVAEFEGPRDNYVIKYLGCGFYMVRNKEKGCEVDKVFNIERLRFSDETVFLQPNIDPDAVDDSATTDEDTQLVLSSSVLLANDSDADDDILSLTSVGNAVNGTVSMDENGTITFTPDQDFNGEASFEYTVDDGFGGTDTASVVVNVTPVNDAPVAEADALTGHEDAAFTFTAEALLANDNDVDVGDVLSVSEIDTSATIGKITDFGDGNYSYDPGESFQYLAVGETATDTFNYKVSDGNGGFDTQTVTITIEGRNDGPVAAADFFTTDEDTALQITADQLLANDSDIDLSDVLTVTGLTADAELGSVIDNGDGTYSYDPGEAFQHLAVGETATDTLTYTISDGNGGTATQTVTVTIEGRNDGPEAVDAVIDTFEGDPVLSGQLVATDPDTTDVLTFSLISELPEGLEFNSDGSYTFDPNVPAYQALARDEKLTMNLQYQVDDGNGGIDIASFVISVTGTNEDPIAVDDTAFAIKDATVVIPASDLLTNDSDPDDDPISIVGVGNAVGGTVGFDGDGNITFTADPGFSGDAVFEYTISDGRGGEDTANVVVNVVDTGNGPVAIGDVLICSCSEPSRVFVDGQRAIYTDGADMSFAPGTDPFSLLGSEKDDAYDLSEYEGDVTVYSGGGEDSIVGGEHTTIFAGDGADTISGGQMVSAGDGDDTISITNPDTTQTIDGGNGEDRLIFLGDAIEHTVYRDGVTNVVVVDGIEVTNVESIEFDDLILRFDPNFDFIACQIKEDKTTVIPAWVLTFNDYHTEGLDFDLTDVFDGPSNDVELNADGDIVFDPAQDFNGMTSFGYQITDENGATDSASVQVYVIPVNDDPVVDGPVSPFTMDEDAVLVLTAEDLLATASDVDGDPLWVHNLSADQGRLDYQGGGVWTFQPQQDWSGEVNLTYAASDGLVDIPTATKIIVNPVDDLPILGDDHAIAVAGRAMIIPVSLLLENDYDVEGDAFSFTRVSDPVGGALSFDTEGNIIFTANEDQRESASFTYTVTDEYGNEVSAQVNMSVYVPGDGPIAVDDWFICDCDDGHVIVPPDGVRIVTLAGEEGTVLDLGESTVTTVYGSEGSNTVLDSEDATIWTGGGDDSVEGKNITVWAGEGNDTVTVVGGPDNTIYAGPGDDTVILSGEPGEAATIDGGSGQNVIEIKYPFWDFECTRSNGTLILQGHNGNSYVISNTSRIEFGNMAINFGPDMAFDSCEIWEDTPVTFPAGLLMLNDSDPYGHEFKITEVLNASDGANVSLTEDGDVYYVPGQDYFGLATFDYVITDEIGNTDTATVHMSIRAINDAPVLPDSDFVLGTIDEDGEFTFSKEELLGQVNDVDSETVYLTELSVSDGTLVDNGDDTYTFKPYANFNGDAQISYSVSDGLLTSSSSLKVVVNSVNDLPVVEGPLLLTTNEDVPLTLDLLANASDQDDELSITDLSVSNGSIANNGDGTWTYVPDDNWNGTAEITYGVSDGEVTIPTSASIEVVSINDAPEVSGPVGFEAWQDRAITFSADDLLANASDVDGDDLTIENLTASSGTITDNGDGTWTFNPAAGSTGAVNLSYDVSDGIDLTSTSGRINVKATTFLEAQGTEFLVNSYTTASQENPSIGRLTDGGFVIAWTSWWQDSSSAGVFAQRYNAEGQKVGSEFQVNSYISSNQMRPSVAGLADGSFVIVYQSDGFDGNRNGVAGQRYDALGNKVGGEFRVNTNTNHDQHIPSVLSFADGGFVVSWTSELERPSVKGQLYDASGNKAGGEFAVPSAGGYIQKYVEMAVLENGNFVAVWQANGQDGSSWGVFGAVLDRNGQRVGGGEFLVNSTTADSQHSPSVTALNDGSFVVTWASVQDGSGTGVYGQRFDEAGGKIGGEFQLNTVTWSSQLEPSITALDDGGFMAVWHGPKTSGNDIVGQRYDVLGQRVGAEIRINDAYSQEQMNPDIEVCSDGKIIVAWQSQEGGNYDIKTKIYGISEVGMVIEGSAGDNILVGGGGDDTLIGGEGNDTYRIGRNDGADLVDNHGEGGSADRVLFGSDIATDQLWFKQTGDDLEVSIIGTDDSVTIDDWYLDANNQVAQFETTTGSKLTSANVQALVDAMATFEPPALGEVNLSSDREAVLGTVIAAAWTD